MAVDTSIIGRETGRARVQVERAPLANFAKAVKDDNAVYSDVNAAEAAGFDGVPAPPTFGFALEFWGRYPELQQGLKPVEGNPMFEVIGKLMQNGGLVLHGEQEFEYHRPIVAGDVLRSEGKVVDAYEKESKGKTMTFVVSETVWSDDKTGEPVLTARFNLIHRR
ncbi:MAG: MaoC family dehydratase [Actinobacteria bacterium]|nr:MAG: MaoC family dehydratase [Actinomycetota bacterium]